MRKRVFISGVSSEFRECRDAIASDLTAVGFEVVEQTDFTQKPMTLLQKLRELVDSCDAVVALIGDAYGWEPPLESLPDDAPRRSYTQWEHFFALGEDVSGPAGKTTPLYAYLGTSIWREAHPTKENPVATELQREHVRRLRRSGRDHQEFGSIEEVRRLVLRDLVKAPTPERKPRNLPYSSIGSLFRGRDTDLDTLAERLLESDARGADDVLVPVQVVHGLGGVGKTRLAVEFAWQRQEEFSALLFVGADSPAALRANLAALCGPLVLDLPQHHEKEEEEKLAAAIRWLNEHPTWFLVLDNVDSPEAAREVEGLLAKLQGGRVVVTSRLSTWSAAFESLGLDMLDHKDARDLLLARTEERRVKTDNDEQEAAALVKELDRLALAIEHAGAYICQRRMRLADYRRRLAGQTDDLLRWHSVQVTGYPRSIALTWTTTFEHLSQEARDLLDVLSWLSSETVPRALFDGDSSEAEERLGALIELENYSMAKWSADGTGFTVHRLVQEATHHRCYGPNEPGEQPASGPDAPMPAGLKTAVTLLETGMPEEAVEGESWDASITLKPHVVSVIEHAGRLGPLRDISMLRRRLGRFLRAQAVYGEAEPVLRAVLESDQAVLGANHPTVASDLIDLSVLLREMGQLPEAEETVRRALAIDEVKNPNSLATARDLMELGEVLYKMRCLPDREPIYRRAMEIRQAYCGPDHIDVAAAANNLASALQDLKQYDEAERLYTYSLSIGRRLLAPNDRRLAQWVNNLASLHSETGRKAEAEKGYREAIAIYEVSAVPEHPSLIVTLMNFASLLATKGRIDEARIAKLRADTIHSHYYGPPDTAEAAGIRAKKFEILGAFDRAEAEFQKAFALEPEHTIVLGNYAFFLQNSVRDTAKARSVYTTVIDLDAGDSVNRANYASLCIVTGEYETAEHELQTAWQQTMPRPDKYTPRVPFLRACLAALRGEDGVRYLGQIKTLLDMGIQPAVHRNSSVAAHVKENAPSAQADLLERVLAAFNSSSAMAAMQELPTWQAIDPAPLV